MLRVMTLIEFISDQGRRRALAEALDTSPDYLWQMASGWRGRRVPLGRCPAIEAATGGAVLCEEMRPDVIWERDARGRVLGYRVRLPGQREAA